MVLAEKWNFICCPYNCSAMSSCSSKSKEKVLEDTSSSRSKMGAFKVTIKEKFTDRPIVTNIHGVETEEEVKNFYGLDGNDIEWYNIEKLQK